MSCSIATGKGNYTHPTLTHVPPSRLPSMTIALVPNLALAARAAPRPPLPPPITRKSVSLEMGAMARDVCEKWREIVLIRLAAGMDESKGRLANSERGCMEVDVVSALLQRGYRGVEGLYTKVSGQT